MDGSLSAAACYRHYPGADPVPPCQGKCLKPLERILYLEHGNSGSCFPRGSTRARLDEKRSCSTGHCFGDKVVAVAEMAFAGGLGADLRLKSVPLAGPVERDDFILFSDIY